MDQQNKVTTPCCNATAYSVHEPNRDSLQYFFCSSCKRLLNGNDLTFLEPALFHPLPYYIKESFQDIFSNEIAELVAEKMKKEKGAALCFEKQDVLFSFEFKKEGFLIFYKVDWKKSDSTSAQWNVEIFESIKAEEYRSKFMWHTFNVPTVHDSKDFIEKYLTLQK